MARNVTLYFDPTCPFSWITSRWLLNAVEQISDATPTFKVMSLFILNEGRDLDPGYRKHIDETYSASHLFTAVEKASDQETLQKFYTAWGERYHAQNRHADQREVAVEALAEAGLDPELIASWDSRECESDARAALAKVHELVGHDVGTPVISFGEGTAYFGPVLTRIPKGEEARDLFIGLEAMTRVQGFSELKRARTDRLDFS